MKKYHIVEEEVVKNIFEVEVPDEVAAKGIDAVYDYWYNIDEPGMYLLDSECQECDIVEAIDVTNVKRIH